MVVAQITPAGNARDVPAQDFVLNDKILLLFLKAFAQCSRSVHATQITRSFQSVCSSRTVCHSYQ